VVAQIGFVLGLAGLMHLLTLPREFVVKQGTVLLGATALLFLVAFDGSVSRTEGLILVTMYVVYVVVLMNGENVPDQEPGHLASGDWKSWLVLIAGLAIVVGSSEMTVTSVINIAHYFQISEALISVLIIGLGTSLPELSISISAVLKKKTQLSVGNIIGSNVLDTLLPIGLAATISAVTFESELLFFDLPFIFLLTALVLVFFYTRRGVTRPEAWIILGIYFLYVAVKLLLF
jgi:cation:H+ antiporter